MSDSTRTQPTRKVLNIEGAPPFSQAEASSIPELLEMMKAVSHVIGDFIDLSLWVPDKEEGARLLTAYSATGTDPSTFHVTAMMFFAMEEMNQVNKGRYEYVIIDEKTSLVGIRNEAQGNLISLLLFAGRGANSVFEQDALDLAKAATPLVMNNGGEENGMGAPVDFREVIAAMAHELSITRANSLARNVSFSSEPISEMPDTSRMDTIYCVLTGKTLRITLRISVDQLTARGIASMSKSVPITQVTPKSSLDFIKEVANLISGGLQKYLQDQGLALGIGLPLAVTAGTLPPSILRKTPFNYIWKVNGEGMTIIFSLGVTVSLGRLFEHLRLPDFKREQEAEGDVELL